VSVILEGTVDSIASRACVDVFASYRVLLKELPKPPSGAPPTPSVGQRPGGTATSLAAVIGFTGSQLRGCLILTTTFDVVARARPESIARGSMSAFSWSDWVMVRDWGGELANQVLGRIKNKLRGFGVTLEVGVPTVFSGSAIAFAKPKSPQARAFVFDAGGQRVSLWFDTTLGRDTVLLESGEEGAKEGDVILF